MAFQQLTLDSMSCASVAANDQCHDFRGALEKRCTALGKSNRREFSVFDVGQWIVDFIWHAFRCLDRDETEA